MNLDLQIVSEHYDPIPEFYTPRLMDIIRRLLTKSAEARPETTEMLLDPYVKETADFLQLPDNDRVIALSPGKKSKSQGSIGAREEQSPAAFGASGPRPPPPPPGKPLSVSAPPGPPPGGPRDAARPKPPLPPPGAVGPGGPPLPSAASNPAGSPNAMQAAPHKPLQIPAENQELFEVLMARIRAVLVIWSEGWLLRGYSCYLIFKRNVAWVNFLKSKKIRVYEV